MRGWWGRARGLRARPNTYPGTPSRRKDTHTDAARRRPRREGGSARAPTRGSWDGRAEGFGEGWGWVWFGVGRHHSGSFGTVLGRPPFLWQCWICSHSVHVFTLYPCVRGAPNFQRLATRILERTAVVDGCRRPGKPTESGAAEGERVIFENTPLGPKSWPRNSLGVRRRHGFYKKALANRCLRVLGSSGKCVLTNRSLMIS